MKRLILTTLGLVLVGAIATAGAPEQGRGRGHAGKAVRAPDSPARASVHVVFGSADVVVLREHYGARYRDLPPGLQKKMMRGGELPPGWRKKFEPFPIAIERRLPPLPAGYRRGVIDGHAVIYDTRTRVIADVAVLF